MLTTNVSVPHDLFRSPVPWAKHIDRLGVTHAAPAPEGSAAPLTLDGAVARLTAAGLHCRGTSVPRLHILGGTSRFEERGVHGFDSGFAILADEEGLLAMVAAVKGAPEEEASFRDLAEAVAFVLHVYGRRGVLATPAGAH